MRRHKMTVYLMPDIAKRVNAAAATGGISLSAIVETALDEHFARESVYGAVETLTRRVGEIDERLSVQHSMLSKVDVAVGMVGRALVGVKEALKHPQSVKPIAIDPQPQPIVTEPEPETTGRSGWFGGGKR